MIRDEMGVIKMIGALTDEIEQRGKIKIDKNA